jgi:hypothetical protein
VTTPVWSRQMVTASPALSAWPRTSLGPTTRSEKMAAFFAVWVSESKTSRARREGKSGSARRCLRRCVLSRRWRSG